jgi:hypothetical protein
MKRNLRDTVPLYDLLQTAIYNYLCWLFINRITIY